MRSKVSENTFAGQTFYVGLDVHKKSWKVTILGQEFEHKTMSQDPDPVILRDYLLRKFPGGTYKAVYESGFCGFTICRDLNRLGIQCGVINASDVPSNHKEKMQKTDKADSRRPLLMNWAKTGRKRKYPNWKPKKKSKKTYWNR